MLRNFEIELKLKVINMHVSCLGATCGSAGDPPEGPASTPNAGRVAAVAAGWRRVARLLPS